MGRNTSLEDQKAAVMVAEVSLNIDFQDRKLCDVIMQLLKMLALRTGIK